MSVCVYVYNERYLDIEIFFNFFKKKSCCRLCGSLLGTLLQAEGAFSSKLRSLWQKELFISHLNKPIEIHFDKIWTAADMQMAQSDARKTFSRKVD